MHCHNDTSFVKSNDNCCRNSLPPLIRCSLKMPSDPHAFFIFKLLTEVRTSSKVIQVGSSKQVLVNSLVMSRTCSSIRTLKSESKSGDSLSVYNFRKKPPHSEAICSGSLQVLPSNRISLPALEWDCFLRELTFSRKKKTAIHFCSPVDFCINFDKILLSTKPVMCSK